MSKFVQTSAEEKQLLRCEPYEGLINVRIENRGISPVSNYEVFCQINNNAPFETILISDTLMPDENSYHEFTYVLDSVVSDYQIRTGVFSAQDEFHYDDTITQILDLHPPVEILHYGLSEHFGEWSIFPPYDWKLYNPDNDVKWMNNSMLDRPAAVLRNYGYNAIGEEDILEMEPFGLRGVSDPILKFDLSYVPTTTHSDQLKVEIYDECGDNLLDIAYNKSGQILATGDAQDTPWKPDDEDIWRTEEIDLNEFIGQTILVRFVNINGNGNNLYISNVTVLRDNKNPNERIISSDLYTPPTSTEDIDSQVRITVFPNPSNGEFHLEIDDKINDEYQVELFDIHGKSILKKKIKSNVEVIDLRKEAKGIYFLKVSSAGLVGIRKIVKN